VSVSVFLADDHAVVRDGLWALLDAESDISVIGDAENGRDAAYQVAQLCPDVVIMDIAMPVLNGIESTLEISVVCPSTRVIILSMHSTTEHVIRALQAGAYGYLLKDSAGVELVDAVRTVHAGHRYLSPKITDRLVDQLVQQPETIIESPLMRLSPREREVLQLAVEGKTNAEIAESLSLSIKTVGTYRSRLMGKLDIHDLPGLVKFAIKHDLTPL
jgi:DNA-binding NarL/FixJ family response regulator